MQHQNLENVLDVIMHQYVMQRRKYLECDGIRTTYSRI
jgi:hypothetical protein